MNTTEDTIAAISTPLGEGGIGIVRLSGPDAVAIAARLFSPSRGRGFDEREPRRLIHGFVTDPDTGRRIDEVLAVVMRAPGTYTREDMAEIHCHGGMLPLRKTLELVMKQGARLAEPGEFTKRAFLNGRIDLSQAEAIMDLIRAKTEAAQRIALGQLSGGLSERITGLRDRAAALCAQIEAHIDFPEDEIEPSSLNEIRKEAASIIDGLSALSRTFEEGRFFREGLRIAIAGRPNVGKSSLLNTLLDRDRAIVTETPGTTRDVIEEYLNINGVPAQVMDTAGIREAHEMAEREGVRRSLRAIDEADIVIAVIDRSVPLHAEDSEVLERLKGKRAIIALNKSDLPAAMRDIPGEASLAGVPMLRISAKTGLGIDELKDTLVDIAVGPDRRGLSQAEMSGVIVTNIRHRLAIDSAAATLGRAASMLGEGQPLEIVAVEVRDCLDRLGEIVGAVTTEDILNRIFSEFCIGK